MSMVGMWKGPEDGGASGGDMMNVDAWRQAKL